MSFDTSVLDAALDRQRAGHEQQRQALVTHVLRLLDDLGPAYGVQRAYIFGSLAKAGRFRPESDIDIAVAQIDARRFFEFSGRLSAELRREVDLMVLSECHFADKIRREGIEWTRSG